MSRKFIDAPQHSRCVHTIKLKDGSTAQCGRWRKVGDYCTQHAKMRRLPIQTPPGWKVYKPTDTDPFFHVAPNFGRKHELDVGVHCWCQPTPDSETPNKLLIHHEEH